MNTKPMINVQARIFDELSDNKIHSLSSVQTNLVKEGYANNTVYVMFKDMLSQKLIISKGGRGVVGDPLVYQLSKSAKRPSDQPHYVKRNTTKSIPVGSTFPKVKHKPAAKMPKKTLAQVSKGTGVVKKKLEENYVMSNIHSLIVAQKAGSVLTKPITNISILGYNVNAQDMKPLYNELKKIFES